MNGSKKKLVRITTVPGSLTGLLKGQLKFMKSNFVVIGVSSFGEKLNLVRKEEEVRVKGINMSRQIAPIKDLIALVYLIIFFLKEKPDIVHTHTPKAGLLGMLAAKITGVPNRLHTVAGMPLLVATGYKRRLLNFIEKLTYLCANKVYPNSKGLRDIIVANNLTNPSKLKVIGKGSSNGINTNEFNPSLVSTGTVLDLRTELGILKDDFVFLFVGRLVGDKGINELTQAFCEINKIFKNTHLILVGSFERHLDPLKTETEFQIQNNNNIHAVGYKSNVIDYFASADVLTFPSYREGFPNVVMQAAAMQLNAIVSDINGCNEIITNGNNGWIIPAKNIELLIDRMVWCINNGYLSAEMGLKSRKIMQADFERKYVWNEILNEYKTILQQ